MKTITTAEQTCCNCGTTFAMDEVLIELRRKDGAAFYCPNGHGMNFTKSIQKTLDETASKLTEANEEIRNLKIEVTRLRCEIAKKDKTLWDKITGGLSA